MDKSAIEAIQANEVMSKIITEWGALSTELNVETLPIHKDWKLENLEHLQPRRGRFRGKYATNEVGSFSDYCFEFGGLELPVFVSSTELLAKCYLDIGTLKVPGHCDHTALVKLNYSTEFLAMKAIDGERMEQKQAAEWLEDWADFITVQDEDGNPLELPRAVAAIRKMEIENVRKHGSDVGTYRAERTASETVTANAECRPGFFEFTCVPHPDLIPRTIKFRINVLAGGSEPRFTFRAIRLDSLVQELVTEFQGLIANEFTEKNKIAEEKRDITVLIGSFDPK